MALLAAFRSDPREFSMPAASGQRQTITVDSPDFSRAIPENHVNPRRITVKARIGIIDVLAQREMLTAAQQQAAQKVRGLYEAVQFCGLCGPGIEPAVDSSRALLLSAEMLVGVVGELREVRGLLGQRSFGLLVALVACDRSLLELAVREDRATRSAICCG
jgi:hypothetical protein